MSGAQCLLNDVIRFSNVDGPGNRYVAFLQGCNFDCAFCHNPYTISVCVDCGICIEPCPQNALGWDPEGAGVVVDWDRCDRCGICVDVCPYDSTPLARRVDVDWLWEDIRRTAPFLSGVTVSGGEATLQPDFLGDLFTVIKERPETASLTTFVDSNGGCTLDVWDRLLPVLDGAMIDLKALDEEVHVALTGRSNGRVLASIRHLASAGILYEVRLPIVAGVNDDPGMLARTADWLADVDPAMRIKVIGFRRHGVRRQHQDLTEPSTDDMARYAEILGARAGTLVTI